MTRTFVLRVLLFALACGLVAACDTKGAAEAGATRVGAAAPDASSAPAADGTPRDASPPATAPTTGGTPTDRATALIGEMIEAYRAAPVLTDRVTMQTVIGGQQRPPSTVTLRLGPGDDFEYSTPYFGIVYVDRTFYVSFTDTADRYLRIDDVDDVISAIRDRLGEGTARLAQLNLRHGRPPTEVVQAFANGLTGTARISGYREIVDVDGTALRQISLITPGGSATVNVNPTTKRLHSIETEEKLAESPVPNLTVRRRTEFDTTVSPSAPPIVFEAGDRFATESIEVLRGVGGGDALKKLQLAPGGAVPDFDLYTILGSRFVLSEHRGTPMVLVFWANWDPVSRDALRQLTAITPWAEENSIDVEVIGVCGMGRTATEEAYWEQTVRFWEEEELPFETLIDRKDDVFRRFGVLGVPMTIVLDKEGRFVNAVAGFEDGSLEAIARIVGGAAIPVDPR